MEKELRKFFQKKTLVLSLILIAVYLPSPGKSEVNNLSNTKDNNLYADEFSALSPEIRHEAIGVLVAQFIQKSHYNNIKIDDELSSKALDLYIKNLDQNRMYFLESDLENFERYRYQLDDIVKNKPLDPVFEIFKVHQVRVRNRLNFAITQLSNEPDIFTDEYYTFERSEEPWAKNEAELNEIWRKRIINDVVSLALEGEQWESIQNILLKRYEGFIKRLDQVNNDDVFERFMNMFSNAVDPHSSYLSPRNADEYRIAMSLSYVGIGATLRTEEDFVQIVNIIKGGPADFDGKLKRDDRITAIAQGKEGEFVDVIGWRLDDVVDIIRGPKDSTVKLQIIPANALPGSPREIIELTRGAVKLEEQAAKSQIVNVKKNGKDLSIGVIEVPGFYRDYSASSWRNSNFTSVTRDVKRLIGELNQEGIDGLVIDVRGNGGGHLTEATALTGLFIKNGPIVQFRKSTNIRRNPPQRLDDPDPVSRVYYDGPLAVLVDRFSASASEIFAGAIQDYSRGIIIGQQTYGKGTVQNLYSLDQYFRKKDDKGLGQLTLTIGKYYRITGESTQHRGVYPDIVLPSNIDINDVGESARENALPWDVVKRTRFNASAPIDSLIQTLKNYHNLRSEIDPNSQYQISRIKANERIRNIKTVSLNIDKRRTARESEVSKALADENKRRKALDLQLIENLEDISEDEVLDIQLDQAANIVADMVVFADLKNPLTTANSYNN